MTLNQSLKKILSEQFPDEILFDEPLARYTTVKVGGPADIFFYPNNLEQLKKGIQFCKSYKIPYFIIGNGSNLLIRDGGIRGFVIKLNRCLNNFKFEEQQDEIFLDVEAGVSLAKVVELSKQQGFSGMESLYGIPGTVGGALIMNAGTREGEIGEKIESVVVIDSSGELKTYQKKQLKFEYRSFKIPRSEVAIQVRLRLTRSTPEKVAEHISFFQKRRHETQPLGEPSMGSVFKNPPKKFAAELIEELGLKGIRVGGARVSEKHSNWIVNEGGATAKDVIALIGLIKDKVKEQAAIRLETEVKIVGEE